MNLDDLGARLTSDLLLPVIGYTPCRILLTHWATRLFCLLHCAMCCNYKTASLCPAWSIRELVLAKSLSICAADKLWLITACATMASETETFVFHSKTAGDEKTITAEPSPAYALTQKKEKSKEDKQPSSVFTLRYTPSGDLEFTSNRKVIRMNIWIKGNKEENSNAWKDCNTTIKAEIIPTNSDVIKQVEQDVYNAQTQAVLHADRVWDTKKDKTEVRAEALLEPPARKRSWWPFKRNKSVSLN